MFSLSHSQFPPFLKDMTVDHWSMIVLWNESSSKEPFSKPDVSLDYTDEPVPFPSPNVPDTFPRCESPFRLGLALAGVVRGCPLAFGFGPALIDGGPTGLR